MAKKKSSKSGGQAAPVSPEKYIRQNARKLPIDKCYINRDWKEGGIAQIVVTRLRPSGNRVVGFYLVDTYCLGVKDAFYYANMNEYDFTDFLKQLGRASQIEEISYNEAHNIIYGAIAFAEEGGIEPAKEFNTPEYILEEDTDDVPLIEYEFGRDGKHLLVIATRKSDMRYIKTLQKNLGDNFQYIMEEEDEEDDFNEDLWSEMMAESERHPLEPHCYDYPDYPSEPVVKNQFIADELLSEANTTGLPDQVIDRILALPAEEAANDISNVILYTIGKTYREIADDTIGKYTECSLMFGVALLAQIGSKAGLKTVLEILRQSNEFVDYHFGDYAPGLIAWALYTTGRDQIEAIVDIMNTPGVDSYHRSYAYDALSMIAYYHPERRSEIIEIVREQLKAMLTRIPELNGGDALAASFLIASVSDISATEVMPEIKALFDADLVDRSLCGNYEAVSKDLAKPDPVVLKNKFTLPEIHKFNSQYKAICAKNRSL